MIKYILNFFKVSNEEDNFDENGNKIYSGNKNKKTNSRHIVAKILAALLAICLWFYVMNEQNPPIEVKHTVPLEIRNLASNYVVVDYPNTVKVTIKGSRMVIAGMKNSDIKCFVDMNGLHEGTHDVVIQAVVPSNIEFIESSTKTASVSIEPVITKSVPITVQFSGQISKEFSVNKVIPDPANSNIKGARNLVQKVNSLSCLVNVAGKSESFSADVSLSPLDLSGNLVEGLIVSPPSTKVWIELQDTFIRKSVQIKPNLVGQLPLNSVIKSITIEPENIEIKATNENKTIFDSTAIIDTEQINISKISRDAILNVNLKMPEGITSNVNKAVITIRLE
ncbi:hypothetical protein LJC10_03685 [Selenomonadales bacterium OttesenSCG-928-I06]|nr:hypothetical protein [Selenomonadales bacterium OttesenSCG-928-I06]